MIPTVRHMKMWPAANRDSNPLKPPEKIDYKYGSVSSQYGEYVLLIL